MAGIPEILQQELSELHQQVAYRHEQQGQVATGRTRDSFSHFLDGPQAGVFRAGTPLSVLEQGRGPSHRPGAGSPGKDTQFTARLREWIVARGLTYGDEKELDRLAHFLAWYISRNGTKAFREGRHLDIISTPLEEFRLGLVQKIARYCCEETEKQILKMARTWIS